MNRILQAVNVALFRHAALRHINAIDIDLCDRGFSYYQNRPRRKVFNIEIAQAIRHNPVQSLKNRMTVAADKLKTGDTA